MKAARARSKNSSGVITMLKGRSSSSRGCRISDFINLVCRAARRRAVDGAAGVCLDQRHLLLPARAGGGQADDPRLQRFPHLLDLGVAAGGKSRGMVSGGGGP